ncbi:MAG: histidine phosphatase family protein, partial [Candidatus Firestonebacteria bacterium]|nr:histidine phosphatase family protein [Candidatus Firestonebacteria bacterium]
KRYLGKTDLSLNIFGTNQAERLACVLKNEQISKIYSSSLQRAIETANIIAEKNKAEVNRDSRLNEISFGKWEGLTFNEISKNNPHFWDEWKNNLNFYCPPDGECLKELMDRVNDFIKKELKKDETIAIVSHSGPIKIILLNALGSTIESFWKLKVDLGSISIIDYNIDSSVVISINDVCHLGYMISV